MATRDFKMYQGGEQGGFNIGKAKLRTQWKVGDAILGIFDYNPMGEDVTAYTPVCAISRKGSHGWEAASITIIESSGGNIIRAILTDGETIDYELGSGNSDVVVYNQGFNDVDTTKRFIEDTDAKKLILLRNVNVGGYYSTMYLSSYGRGTYEFFGGFSTLRLTITRYGSDDPVPNWGDTQYFTPMKEVIHDDTLEGTGTEVYPLGCKQIKLVSNPEYLYAVLSGDNTFLFGIKKDGTVEWAKGLPKPVVDALNELNNRLDSHDSLLDEKVDKVAGKSLIDEVFSNGVEISRNLEYVYVVTDANNKLIFGVKKDGSFEWAKGLPPRLQKELDTIFESLSNKQDKVSGKWLIDSNVSEHCDSNDNPEWFAALLDTAGKIVSSISNSGEYHFNRPVHLNGGVDWSVDNLSQLTKALKDGGFTGGTGDWSDSKSIEIPVPEMAVINFTNIDQMPQTKTTDAHAIMEFWDMNGNYFKKKAIANAQGSSSMNWAKKNIGIDICNDDWVGDDTFKIKFGSWVPQDSFHIKAYATDYFRCVGLSGYDLVKKILDTRPLNTTWKQATDYGDDPIAQKSVTPSTDSGALCYPQGFICKVYLNGEFEGLFCWQLKKHRDNYNMDKKSTTNIHLDGMLGGNFFNGIIDWTAFEVRNPKNLVTYTGVDYDGENPTELIDSTSPAYDASNKNHVNTAKVKQYIINLSHRMGEIGADKTLFEKYFGLDSCVDYAILSDVLYNYDYVKNLQWTTWDGVKWFANPYDLDCTIGANSGGDAIRYPTTSHTTVATNHPLSFVVNNYVADLERRWKELRDLRVIDAHSIASNLEHYVRLFGKSGYADEYKKWTDVPCNRNPVIDIENWELEVDGNGDPVIYTTPYHTWSNAYNYAAGAVVQYSYTGSSVPGGLGWWYRFTAKRGNLLNKPPITRGGFTDNIFRVYNWLKLQISNMDSVYNYNV